MAGRRKNTPKVPEFAYFNVFWHGAAIELLKRKRGKPSQLKLIPWPEFPSQNE